MSIAECPRCGHHLATEFKEGVPALQAEVRRLEDLIPRLQEEKAILLRRINDAQEKTRRLPFEVLSKIFQFARPPMDFTTHEPPFAAHESTSYYYIDNLDYPPLTCYHDFEEDFLYTLAAVSHRWRQVALSTPQLWTSISLRVLITFTKFNTSLLDQHFKNARNLPISIRLDLSIPALLWKKSPLERSDFLMQLEDLKVTIFEDNADKVRSLVLVEPPAEWVSSICGNLSRCNSVTISKLKADPYCYFLDFEDLPCLQHLKLVGSRVPLALPATVSALQLCHSRLNEESLRLLTELPNLVELEIIGGTLSFGFHDSVIEPIVFHRLETLTCAMDIDQNLSFLHHVRFVNLNTLQWSEHNIPVSVGGESLRIEFFSSLPSTLSTLVFNALKLDAHSVIYLLHCVPQLAELNLTQCPQEVVVGVIEAIGRPLPIMGWSSSDSDVLPNLYVLSASDTVSDARLDPCIFVEMLEALHATGPRQKPFHLIIHSDVTWHSDALQQVRTLLSSGLDAKVTFDSGKSTLSIP